MVAGVEWGLSDCEQLGSGWLVQPVNAVSSLAFVPAGAWVARQACDHTGWRRWELRGIGAALVANGLGSFAYHGPQPPWAGFAHDGPIVALVALVVLNEAGRRRQPEPAPPVRPRARRAGRLALATGLAALAAYGLGRTGSPACRPESAFQWHAAWHGLAAAAFAAGAVALVERG